VVAVRVVVCRVRVAHPAVEGSGCVGELPSVVVGQLQPGLAEALRTFRSHCNQLGSARNYGVVGNGRGCENHLAIVTDHPPLSFGAGAGAV